MLRKVSFFYVVILLSGGGKASSIRNVFATGRGSTSAQSAYDLCCNRKSKPQPLSSSPQQVCFRQYLLPVTPGRQSQTAPSSLPKNLNMTDCKHGHILVNEILRSKEQQILTHVMNLKSVILSLRNSRQRGWGGFRDVCQGRKYCFLQKGTQGDGHALPQG